MDQVTFTDVLQKSFIAMSMGGADRLTTLNIILNISMSFFVGMFIFFVYKTTFQGVLYQRSFNLSLVLASTVTSLVIMTISGNLILSLGMVGALSIVRFRTPIKDTMDLVFLFWAIAAGIANGVGFYNVSIICSIMIAVFLIVMTRRPGASADTFLLVIQLSSLDAEEAVMAEIRKNVRQLAVKSKTVSDHSTEITLEIRTDEGSSDFMNELQSWDNVTRLAIVAYDQDLASVS